MSGPGKQPVSVGQEPTEDPFLGVYWRGNWHRFAGASVDPPPAPTQTPPPEAPTGDDKDPKPGDGKPTDQQTDPQLGPDGKPWDPARAAETIANLRQVEKAKRQQDKELADLQKKLKDIEDKDLSEAEKTKAKLAELEGEKSAWATERQQLRVEAEIARLSGTLKIVDQEAAIKLLDWSKIEYADDGKPTNLEQALKDLIKAKPYLEAKESTTVNGVPVTPKSDGDRTMSPEQTKAAKEAAAMFTHSAF